MTFNITQEGKRMIAVFTSKIIDNDNEVARFTIIRLNDNFILAR